MLIKSVRGYNPTFGKNCYFAENSTIIGDVIIGDQVSVWFQAVIRGDVNSIRIGNKVNIQDGVIIHGTYKKASTNIGDNVSIGHNAIIHGCKLHCFLVTVKLESKRLIFYLTLLFTTYLLFQALQSQRPSHQCIYSWNGWL